ncbi:MAG: enoyl-CoA hydratase/isomerase family protein [Pseudonocardia sp.]|nr:enoyl-CoA hydratase/isomerase family protein [Pseudonocardia sp.]
MIERLEVGTDGRITLLRIEHGPVNAMDLELCRELTGLLTDAAAGPAGAVVLTGTGRAFSAGVDLRRLLDGGASYVGEFVPALEELFRVAFTLPKPLIAAVNGHAIAGGAVLAAAADAAVMAEGKGRMGVPEIKVGVPLPQTAFEVVRYRLGEVTARRVVLDADTYDPAGALALGFVDEVVEPEKVLDHAIDVANRLLADVPADTFAFTKAQLRREGVERAARADTADLLEIWCRRVEDGWTARYLEQATRR